MFLFHLLHCSQFGMDREHSSGETTCTGCMGRPPSNPPSIPSYRPIRSPAINIPPHQNPQQSILHTPVPTPLPVPVITHPHAFIVPSTRIHSQSDLSVFHDSQVSLSFLGFLAALSDSVRSIKISEVQPNPSTAPLLSLLSSLHLLIDQTPPLANPSRYGNLSFRQWHQKLVLSSHSLLSKILSPGLLPALPEIQPYLADSFGNPSRIDYGTGHETNFAAFLYCLARIGLLHEPDYPSVVLSVFTSYVSLMRRLQEVYSLEPAGSHGVWGLDDYHFLPYVFGSSQLVNHKYMRPKSIHNQDILDNFSQDYMYLECIASIKKVKKGPFMEHSPMLDDISGVPNWRKVNSGMLKMYSVEVLAKIPIMQHFLFGSLIKWEKTEESA